MATIGNTATGGFNIATSTDGTVVANKYTAGSTFNVLAMVVLFNAINNGGTMYFAIYDDSAGSPNTVIGSGSTPFPAGTGITIDTALAASIISGSDYWVAVYAYVDGTHNIQWKAESASQAIQTWNEAVEGSWTATPSIAEHTASRELSYYGTSVFPTRIIKSPFPPRDNITITESVTVGPPLPLSKTMDVSDTLTITENVAVTVNAATPRTVNTNDSITITEATPVSLQSPVNTSDTITLTESVSVEVSQNPFKINIAGYTGVRVM